MFTFDDIQNALANLQRHVDESIHPNKIHQAKELIIRLRRVDAHAHLELMPRPILNQIQKDLDEAATFEDLSK